eukprot:SAG22_NODE_972_length_6227_cov_16.910085_5_plen_86_part_00
MLATLPAVWPAAAAADFPAAIGDPKQYDTAAVKKLHLRAIRLVHPDRLGLAARDNPEAAATAALVFSHLSDAKEAFLKKHAHRDK